MMNRINNMLARSLKRDGSVGSFFNAMIQVKLGRPLLTLFISLARAVGGQLSRSTVLVVITFVSHCSRIARKSGIRFLVIYLKAQYVNLMQSLASSSARDMSPLGCRFSRTGKGLPRAIPILHRVAIRRGSAFHIRLWLSLFSFYRILEFPGTVSLSTITTPFSVNGELLSSFSEFVIGSFRPALIKYFPSKWLVLSLNDRLEALKQLVVRPSASSRSTPSIPEYSSTSLYGIISTLGAWRKSSLLPFLKDWLKITGNIRFLNWLEESLRALPVLPKIRVKSLGKIGLKDEAAGKVRVFAMVDCFTQWIFKPLHDRIFEILGMIPQDGTFNQERPLARLSELGKMGRSLYSYDLSAATDRLPVLIQACLMSALIGSHGANLWMTLLVSRSYDLPARAGKGSVMYAVGQPMGALTSWAMLALTHHALVQWAALRSHVITVGEWFEDYAILGDDVVIAHSRVAKSYLELMEVLGVKVGIHKSLISLTGEALEFAKRFIYRGVSVGPIPFLELMAAQKSIPAILEFAKKYSLTLSCVAALSGFGYRAIGSMNRYIFSIGSRLRTLLVSWVAPGSNAAQSFLDFLAFRGFGRKIELTVEQRQSLFDMIKSDLTARLASISVTIRLVKELVTVDRTAAHYAEKPKKTPKASKGRRFPHLTLSNWWTVLLDPVKGRGIRQPRITNPDLPDENRVEVLLWAYMSSISLPDLGVPTLDILETELRKMFDENLSFFDYVIAWDRIWFEYKYNPLAKLAEKLFLDLTVELKPRQVWEVIEKYLPTAASPQVVDPVRPQTPAIKRLCPWSDEFNQPWIRTYFEYVYREFFLDTVSDYMKIQTILEGLTLSTTVEEYESLLRQLDKLESDLALIPLLPASDKAHPEKPRLRPGLSIWVRRWRRVVKSTHHRPT